MKYPITAAALGAALVLGATAQTMAPMPMASEKPAGAMKMAATTQIRLAAQNKSGETGTATLMDGTKGLIVKVRMTGGGSEDQPAHIHPGTCEKLNPHPKYPLKNIHDGESETTIPDVTIAQLEKGEYAINVHKSTQDIATYVSCGNIVAPK